MIHKLLQFLHLKDFFKLINNDPQLTQAKKGEACPGCNYVSEEEMTDYHLFYNGEEIIVQICTDCNKTPNE